MNISETAALDTETGEDGPAAVAVVPAAPTPAVLRERGADARRAAWRWIRRVGPGFLIARALVLGALGLARYIVDHLDVHDPAVVARVNEGLLGWDAAFYRQIAAHGYASAGAGAYRFFPLTPLAARVLTALPGVSAGTGLLIVANGATLVACVLIYRLTLSETGSERTALLAGWLLCLAPPAFVLVMGYSEPLLLVTTLWTFIELRSRRFGTAAVAGVLSGLGRPLGVLLAIPAAIEASRGWSAADLRERTRRVAAVLGAPVGTLAYLGWCELSGPGFLAPLREALGNDHRGSFTDPLATLARDAADLARGTHIGTGMHLPWVVVLVGLVGVAFWKLPSSYGWYGAAVLAVALTAPNLDSLERYALGSFVFVIAAAIVAERRRLEWAVLAVAAGGLVAYSLLAFLNAYVP